MTIGAACREIQQTRQQMIKFNTTKGHTQRSEHLKTCVASIRVKAVHCCGDRWIANSFVMEISA